MAPGHAITPGLRLTVAITPECLGCHTDAPPPATFPLNASADRWEARGISCAACHGAARAHARWREAELAGEPLDVPDDPILSYDSLSRVERMSICAGCHLQGDARIPLEPQRLGPPPPGGDVLERRAVFVAAEPTDEIGFVSQTERLVLSRCYLESRMSCGSCHDPHRSLEEPGERARVRAACASCHEGDPHTGLTTAVPASSDADCVTCHMPRVGVFDVDHVRIHDHYIRRAPSAPPEKRALRMHESPSGAWERFRWPDTEPPEHIDDPGLWMMALSHGSHIARAVQHLDETPGPRVARLPMYHHSRGSLLERIGRPEDAIVAYEKALELDPDLAPSGVNLGLLLGRRRQYDEALNVLNRVVARFPLAEGALRNRAVVRFDAGDVDGFARDLEAAFELLPSAAVAAGLASHFERMGEAERARSWRKKARSADPLTAR